MVFVNKKNLYACSEKKVNSGYFNGTVVIREVYNGDNSQDQELYFVEFSNGALTTMHFHETEQILIPVYGKGVVGELRENSISNFEIDDIDLNYLDIGEIVSIPSNTLHFHGALPKQNFTHVAFRKLFDYECKNDVKSPYPTQTKWVSDFIGDELGSADPETIKNELGTISDKVNQSIRRFILG
jgi:quercetin dioxygenase-like cupin family protein